MDKNRLIGISGNAGSGKDTLFGILNEYHNFKCCRIAFADKLKIEIDPFLQDKAKISAFTQDKKDKTLIRDFMVAYGKIQRTKSKGTYFTSAVQQLANRERSKGLIPIITDLRYDEYPEDEIFWVKERNAGLVFYIERIDENGVLIGPPNQDEAINNPKLRAKADLIITCPTFKPSDNPKSFFFPILDKFYG